jgi:1-deoxy-D-xylulose-5-phosphate synthase
MAPGDEPDVAAMLEFALAHNGPVAVRFPKAAVETLARQFAPIEMGRAEVLRVGGDGVLIGCGTLVCACMKAAALLADEGLELGVINARFVKPLDTDTILRALREAPFVVTVEEGALAGGFGSAVLEAAADAGLDTSKLRRLGIPDRFIEHGSRDALLADLGLNAHSMAQVCRDLSVSRTGVAVEK